MYRLPAVNPVWMLEETDSTRLKQQHPDLWDDPKTTCKTCMFHTKPDKAKTFRWWNPERTEIVEWECDCTAQWVMHRKLLHHGIGMNYQRLGWADAVDVPSSVQMAALEYLESAPWYVERGMNLIFHSPDSGTGKTMMAMLLGKGLVEAGVDFFAAQMNTIFELYTSGWRSKEEKEYFERRVMNCAVLGIDDWGKERGTDNRNEHVDSLVDRIWRHRIANAKPIVATSNFTRENLDKAYGPYVASLLLESTIFVESSGANWREKSGQRLIEETKQKLCRPVVIR